MPIHPTPVRRSTVPLHVNLADLLHYTDWERQEWRAWFRAHGAGALQVAVGPHGDGRFRVVGDLIRHIFSAETRYVERLSGRPLTDTASIPADDPEVLFDFGERSRKELRAFITGCPATRWDTPEELQIGNLRRRATPRKIVLHVVLHEIRHWGQVATLLRLGGLTAGLHDFLFSPVFEGDGAPAAEEKSR